jgi:hypothetical protein
MPIFESLMPVVLAEWAQAHLDPHGRLLEQWR